MYMIVTNTCTCYCYDWSGFFFLNYYSQLRQAYLKQGGTDPEILAQMAQLEAEAWTAEGKSKQSKRTPRGEFVIWKVLNSRVTVLK